MDDILVVENHHYFLLVPRAPVFKKADEPSSVGIAFLHSLGQTMYLFIITSGNLQNLIGKLNSKWSEAEQVGINVSHLGIKRLCYN